MKRRSIGHPSIRRANRCRRTRKLWIGCDPVAWFIRSPRRAGANRCAPILLYLEILFAPIPVTVFRSIESRFHQRPNKRRASNRNCLGGGESEFSRDNRETTNFSLSLHPFLLRHASPPPLLFQCLRVHFLPRVGPDTGPLGKGDPKFSAFRGDETEQEDKMPRTDDWPCRVTASRKGVCTSVKGEGRASFLACYTRVRPRFHHGYVQTPRTM